LEVEVHIVTASISHLNNLMKAVSEAGFEVIAPVYGLLALGEFLVTPEERELGSLLVDVGGQTLSIGVYSEGALRYSRELALGADFITRDLAVGLRTNTPTAEKLKIEHGVAHPSLLNGDTDVEFKGMDGRTTLRVKTATIMNIILPRVEEIFTVVSDEVQNSNYADLAVPGGTILSGGGAMLQGMTKACEQVLGMPARPGLVHPDSVSASEALMEPAYATALALVCYSPDGRHESAGRARGAEPRWMRRVKGIFKELF
jgi:cell division protein FtsA